MPSRKQLAEDARPDFEEGQLMAEASAHEKALDAWRDEANDYAAQLDELLTMMSKTARRAECLESQRRRLLAQQRRLKASGVHVDRPGFPDDASRLVADGAVKGQRSAIAALAWQAKERC
jgi:hypothetical protein